MSNQRFIPLKQNAVLFSGRVIAIVEQLDDQAITSEQALGRIVEIVHELPLCIDPETES